MIDRAAAALGPHLLRHWKPGLALVLALTAVSAIFATRLRFDMSFEPLFSDDESLRALTEQHEDDFGVESSADLVAVLRHDDVLSPAFLAEVDDVSRQVLAIDEVSDVQSLTRVPSIRVDPTTGETVITGSYDPARPEESAGTLRANPLVVGRLLSESEEATLITARIDVPFGDLAGRRPVLEDFRDTVRAAVDDSTEVTFTGTSEVESSVAAAISRGINVNMAIIVGAAALLLWWYFRSLAAAAVTMLGVGLAQPMVLATMHGIGSKMTIVNSQVQVMVLIVGLTMALHMVDRYIVSLAGGLRRDQAALAMLRVLATPTVFTVATTMVGFASLLTADVRATREFGLAVVLGIGIVFILNVLIVPWGCVLLVRAPGRQRQPGGFGAGLRWLGGQLARHPRTISATTLGLVAVLAVVGIPRLSFSQGFNEDFGPDHPVSQGQVLLEEEFVGFLSPVYRQQAPPGRTLLDPSVRQEVAAFAQAASDVDGVLSTLSYVDLVPPQLSEAEASIHLDQLRDDDRTAGLVNSLLTADNTTASTVLTVRDVGSTRAADLVDELDRAADRTAPTISSTIVGRWWRAQTGLNGLVDDMWASTLTAILVVLPLVAVALRRTRLTLVALVPNLVPLIAAVALMGVLGIIVRVATAMILAIALGLAADDTIHILSTIRDGEDDGVDLEQRLRDTLGTTGRPCLFSTVILVVGFLAMTTSELRAIRDVGVVGALTMSIAVAADLIIGPAVYVLVTDRHRLVQRLLPHLRPGRPGLDP